MSNSCHRAVVRRQEAAGLVFTKTVYEPHTVLRRHTHANAYLSFASTGSYTENVGRVTKRCDPTAVLLHEAGETHEDLFHDRPVHLLRIEATDSNLLDIAVPEVTRGERSLQLCRRMLGELQSPDDLTSLVLHGLALELVADLARASRGDKAPGPAWLKRIDELLNETYLETLRLPEVAAAVGVHPVHLCRTYSRLRGQTVGDRVRELRLQRACSLLTDSDQPIGEIAVACGFSDHSHLSRLMRRRLGVSPSQYRQLR